jgi:hypothetical protein
VNQKLERKLGSVEVDLLRGAADGGVGVGGVLQEALEILCNSYGLVEEDFRTTNERPLGSWIITPAGRSVLEQYKHDQPCDHCGRMFLRGTLARRYWYETNLYLCKECLEARGESVDPIDYNFTDQEFGMVVASLVEANERIKRLEARLEEAQKTNDLVRDIRYEVMQYPMNEPAEKLVNTLYELMR